MNETAEGIMLGVAVRFCHECPLVNQQAEWEVEVKNQFVQSVVIRVERTANGVRLVVLPRTREKDGQVLAVGESLAVKGGVGR